MGANSFLYEMPQIDVEGNNENDRVASRVSILIDSNALHLMEYPVLETVYVGRLCRFIVLLCMAASIV